MAVLSNYERHHLNRKQAEAFARAHGLPLVMWKLPLAGAAAELLDAATMDELYENEPGLWGMLPGRETMYRLRLSGSGKLSSLDRFSLSLSAGKGR